MICWYRLYREKLTQVVEKLKEVEAEEAGEYLNPVAQLDENRRTRLSVASQWFLIFCLGFVFFIFVSSLLWFVSVSHTIDNSVQTVPVSFSLDILVNVFDIFHRVFDYIYDTRMSVSVPRVTLLWLKHLSIKHFIVLKLISLILFGIMDQIHAVLSCDVKLHPHQVSHFSMSVVAFLCWYVMRQLATFLRIQLYLH